MKLVNMNKNQSYIVGQNYRKRYNAYRGGNMEFMTTKDAVKKMEYK